jgi:hypothetical protein
MTSYSRPANIGESLWYIKSRVSPLFSTSLSIPAHLSRNLSNCILSLQSLVYSLVPTLHTHSASNSSDSAVASDRPWYKDPNGDGIGDIQGVISKLDYLQDFGINVI